MKFGRVLALTAFAGLAVGNHAVAATFCISNASQLGPALLAAHGNAEDDTIYLEVGTFLTAAELSYFAAPDETYQLSIIGGMAPGCQSYASSGDTVLDGQNTHRILTINAYGEVDIARITFQHGNPTQYFGGAVSLTNSGGDSYLISDFFVANKTASGAGGGALYFASAVQDSTFVWSSVFIANSSSAGAIYASGNGSAYLTGNTIIANSLFNDTGLAGGIDITGSGFTYLSNNVLWNNTNADVYDQVGHAHYANNDIGVRGGFAPLSVANELNVDPDFSGFLGLRPAPDSPLVNAGLDAPPGGVGGCCDAGGDDRTQGKHVDIGAYETDILFRDGFGK